jgi:hypothetical protein
MQLFSFMSKIRNNCNFSNPLGQTMVQCGFVSHNVLLEFAWYVCNQKNEEVPFLITSYRSIQWESFGMLGEKLLFYHWSGSLLFKRYVRNMTTVHSYSIDWRLNILQMDILFRIRIIIRFDNNKKNTTQGAAVRISFYFKAWYLVMFATIITIIFIHIFLKEYYIWEL